MKIEVKFAEESITVSQNATVLDLVLTVHKACRAKSLPLPMYYSIFFPEGYFCSIFFNQYQLTSELKEFLLTKGCPINTSYAIERSATNSIAILSLRALRQRMRKIIRIMLSREIDSYYVDVKKSDVRIPKIAEISPKTLRMLTSLKKHNSEEKYPENQLISNQEILEIEKYIKEQTSLKLLIERCDGSSDRTLIDTGENYQLEEDTDLAFPLPVSDKFMFKGYFLDTVPKFINDLKKIFIDIKAKKLTFNKNYTLKIFEFHFNDIINQLKKDGKIDQYTINHFIISIDRLLLVEPQLLDALISTNKDFVHYLKIEYKEEYRKYLYYSVVNNSVNNLIVLQKLGWEVSERNFSDAIINNAVDSLTYLLHKFKISYRKRLELAKISRETGNLTMINLLIPEEPVFYFSEIINDISEAAAGILQGASIQLSCMKKDKIFLLVSKAYRYSNIESVQKNCFDFIVCLKNLFPSTQFNYIIDEIQKEINRAHDEFSKWGNQIAWYYTKKASSDLETVYPGANIHDITSEIDFGMENFDLVEQLCDRKFPKTKLDCIKDLELPICEPPKNFYSMRDLLKIMSNARSQQARSRLEEGPGEFSRVRQLSCPGTNCRDRYDLMQPLIETMATLSSDDSLDVYSEGYELQYKGEVISAVMINKHANCWTWHHGLATKEIVAKFWPDVERLHKKLFDMDAKQILDHPQAFYQDVVEVLWLMGNLQVMERGTGSYVEKWFAMVHRIHGLPIPKLKLGQLDCYNITFNLPVYKKIFLYFFDLQSLHPKVVADMKRQYIEDPETRPLVKKFNLAVPADFTAAVQEDKSSVQEKEIKTTVQQKWQKAFQMLHTDGLESAIELTDTSSVSKEIRALLTHYASRHAQQHVSIPWLRLTHLLYQQMNLLIATHTPDTLAMAVIIGQQISATLATEDYLTLKSNCANSEHILYRTLNKNIFLCDPKFKKFSTSPILFQVKKLITEIDKDEASNAGCIAPLMS